MKYGYARVSTIHQAKDGNSLEAQRDRLKEAGAEEIYVDSFTGTKVDRPELSKLRGMLRSGDTLIVTKLDRLARSASQGSMLIEALIESGVTVHVLNMGIMDNTPTGKLIRNIMFSFAEFERDMIVERTQEGRAVAKARGDMKDGRPRKDIPEGVLKKFSEKQKKGEITVNEICKKLGIGRVTWYNRVKELGL